MAALCRANAPCGSRVKCALEQHRLRCDAHTDRRRAQRTAAATAAHSSPQNMRPAGLTVIGADSGHYCSPELVARTVDGHCDRSQRAQRVRQPEGQAVGARRRGAPAAAPEGVVVVHRVCCNREVRWSMLGDTASLAEQLSWPSVPAAAGRPMLLRSCRRRSRQLLWGGQCCGHVVTI